MAGAPPLTERNWYIYIYICMCILLILTWPRRSGKLGSLKPSRALRLGKRSSSARLRRSPPPQIMGKKVRP